ncbi:MAG: tetratricopeptide repeat protein [Deltaproteobacteria bacterium]|nr:tetratricopeptide repeat protein [Deltaproteobacteria bacterium]
MSEPPIRLREKAYAICRKALGAGHPRTLASYHDLADSHALAKDFGRARDLFKLVVAGRRKVLGPGHPDTAVSVFCLAFCVKVSKSARQARALLEQGLSDARQALGPGHPAVIKVASLLATLYWEQNDTESALKLKLSLLKEKRERLLPPGWPSPLAAALAEPCGEDEFSALSGGDPAARARLLGDSAQAAFAGVFMEAAIKIETYEFRRVDKLLTELQDLSLAEDPDSGGDADMAFMYAEAMCGLGAAVLALQTYGMVLNARTEALGPAHPDTVLTLLGLATAYSVSAQSISALKFTEFAWKELKKRKKPQWPDPVTEAAALEWLGELMLSLGDLAGFAAVLERLVSLTGKALGRGHRLTLRPATVLSVLHALNGDAAKALKYRKLSLEAERKLRGGGGKP